MVMSLTDLLTNAATRDEARRLLDPYLPEYSRTVATRARVKNSSGHPQLAGIAFDYAVRLELQHIAGLPSVPWVAEASVLKLGRSPLASRAARVVQAARAESKAGWCTDTKKRHASIATHASKLAQLDQVWRADYPPTFGEQDGVAESAIVAEVEQLMAIAKPAWALAARSPLLLNPTFGAASALVGGADADLIAGDMLLEIKTTQQGVIERDHMRQLIGYVALAASSEDEPVRLAAVGVYFPRFGILQPVPLPRHLDDRARRSLGTRLGELWRRRLAA